MSEIVFGERSELSSRQQQMLQLAAEGFTDKEIAIQLQLSLGTVRTYWDRLRIRFCSQSRTEIIARVLLNELKRVTAERDMLLAQLSLNLADLTPVQQATICSLEMIVA